MTTEEIVSNLRKNIHYIGLDPIELELDNFVCERRITYSVFKEVTNLGKNIEFNELLHQINKDSSIKEKEKVKLFIENFNKIFNYCNTKNHQYTEIKINLDKMKYKLEEFNEKLGIVFLSIENFELIKKSFYEGNPLVEDLFFDLSSLDLGQLCRIKNEISIETKIFT